QRHRAKLCPESRPTASSVFRFAPAQKSPVCRQRCRLLAQGDTRARSVRVIAPVRIESKGKVNARPTAGVSSAPIGWKSVTLLSSSHPTDRVRCAPCDDNDHLALSSPLLFQGRG